MKLKRVTIVVVVCALVGALAGIAGSAAAPSKSSKKSSAQARKQADAMKAKALRKAMRGRPGFGFRMGGPGMMGGPVHSETVVPKRDGSGFLTITMDSGTLKSVDGTTLHVKEGTDKATYKDDAAIDVGSDAKVIRNGKDATLGDLKEGDHVHVITGTPKGNIVIAADDAFLAQRKKDFGERGFHHHGFGPGGPPPGAPAPGDYPGDGQGSGSNS